MSHSQKGCGSGKKSIKKKLKKFIRSKTKKAKAVPSAPVRTIQPQTLKDVAAQVLGSNQAYATRKIGSLAGKFPVPGNTGSIPFTNPAQQAVAAARAVTDPSSEQRQKLNELQVQYALELDRSNRKTAREDQLRQETIRREDEIFARNRQLEIDKEKAAANIQFQRELAAATEKKEQRAFERQKEATREQERIEDRKIALEERRITSNYTYQQKLFEMNKLAAEFRNSELKFLRDMSKEDKEYARSVALAEQARQDKIAEITAKAAVRKEEFDRKVVESDRVFTRQSEQDKYQKDEAVAKRNAEDKRTEKLKEIEKEKRADQLAYEEKIFQIKSDMQKAEREADATRAYNLTLEKARIDAAHALQRAALDDATYRARAEIQNTAADLEARRSVGVKYVDAAIDVAKQQQLNANSQQQQLILAQQQQQQQQQQVLQQMQAQPQTAPVQQRLAFNPPPAPAPAPAPAPVEQQDVDMAAAAPRLPLAPPPPPPQAAINIDSSFTAAPRPGMKLDLKTAIETEGDLLKEQMEARTRRGEKYKPKINLDDPNRAAKLEESRRKRELAMESNAQRNEKVRKEAEALAQQRIAAEIQARKQQELLNPTLSPRSQRRADRARNAAPVSIPNPPMNLNSREEEVLPGQFLRVGGPGTGILDYRPESASRALVPVSATSSSGTLASYRDPEDQLFAGSKHELRDAYTANPSTIAGTLSTPQLIPAPAGKRRDPLGASERLDGDEGMEKVGDGKAENEDKGLSDKEIDEIMEDKVSEAATNSFRGVYSYDELDEIEDLPLDEPSSLVINLDRSSGPGTHWVALWIDPRPKTRSVEYFDSFGEEPPKRLAEKIQQLAKNNFDELPELLKFKTNGVKRQSVSSPNCGFFAIEFISKRADGIPFNEATGYKQASLVSEGEEKIRKVRHNFGFI